MLRSPKGELISAAAVFFVALFIYVATLAPTVTLVDSGELILAARTLGVAHPPGFPLYLMLAHLASLLPIGNVAVRVNFASAFFAALACAMIALVVAEILITAAYAHESKGKPSKRDRKRKKMPHSSVASTDTSGIWRRTIAPSLGAGLLLAFSRTLWAYATIAEVYTLNAFLILTIFLLMLRWRRCIVEDGGSTIGRHINAKHDFLLYTAAGIFGLALGVHHVTVALMLPALAVLVYRTQGLKFFLSKRLVYAALISFAALICVYAYLPLVASASPLFNWGDPRSLRAIWWHITGRQYQVFFSFAPQFAAEELRKFFALLLNEYGFWWLPLALILAVIGYISALRRDRTAFWFLGLIFLCDLAYGLGYNIAEDKDAYYLPAFISITIAVGFGLREFLQRIPIKIRRVGTLLALLIPLIALAGNWAFNNRSHYFIAHDYVENIQSTIKPNGLLLTMDWQVASPCFTPARSNIVAAISEPSTFYCCGAPGISSICGAPIRI